MLAGAVGVSALGTLAMTRMAQPILAPDFAVPTNRRVDARCSPARPCSASAGLGRLLPRPALAGLAIGLPEAGAFAAAMLAGMALYRLVAERRPPGPAGRPPRPTSRTGPPPSSLVDEAGVVSRVDDRAGHDGDEGGWRAIRAERSIRLAEARHAPRTLDPL